MKLIENVLKLLAHSSSTRICRKATESNTFPKSSPGAHTHKGTVKRMVWCVSESDIIIHCNPPGQGLRLCGQLSPLGNFCEQLKEPHRSQPWLGVWRESLPLPGPAVCVGGVYTYMTSRWDYSCFRENPHHC